MPALWSTAAKNQQRDWHSVYSVLGFLINTLNQCLHEFLVVELIPAWGQDCSLLPMIDSHCPLTLGPALDAAGSVLILLWASRQVSRLEACCFYNSDPVPSDQMGVHENKDPFCPSVRLW